jgi:uncharacterized protein YecT (DUF1311 family)
MMKTRFSFIFGAVLLGAMTIGPAPGSAAIPGQPNPADVKTIDACLADAAKAKSDPDVCIGRIWNDCLGAAQTTAAKKECSERELLVWDAALNRDYMQLEAFLIDANAKQTLRDAERAYAIAKLKKCTFERIAHKDDPASLVAAARCDVRETARQDLWLLDQINSFKSP